MERKASRGEFPLFVKRHLCAAFPTLSSKTSGILRMMLQHGVRPWGIAFTCLHSPWFCASCSHVLCKPQLLPHCRLYATLLRHSLHRASPALPSILESASRTQDAFMPMKLLQPSTSTAHPRVLALGNAPLGWPQLSGLWIWPPFSAFG